MRSCRGINSTCCYHSRHIIPLIAWRICPGAAGSVTLTQRFLGLPALTYLRPGEGAGDASLWQSWSIGGRELAGIWTLSMVFAAVVVFQAFRAARAAFSRDLTLRQASPLQLHCTAADARWHVQAQLLLLRFLAASVATPCRRSGTASATCWLTWPSPPS